MFFQARNNIYNKCCFFSKTNKGHCGKVVFKSPQWGIPARELGAGMLMQEISASPQARGLRRAASLQRPNSSDDAVLEKTCVAPTAIVSSSLACCSLLCKGDAVLRTETRDHILLSVFYKRRKQNSFQAAFLQQRYLPTLAQFCCSLSPPTVSTGA